MFAISTREKDSLAVGRGAHLRLTRPGPGERCPKCHRAAGSSPRCALCNPLPLLKAARMVLDGKSNLADALDALEASLTGLGPARVLVMTDDKGSVRIIREGEVEVAVLRWEYLRGGDIEEVPEWAVKAMSAEEQDDYRRHLAYARRQRLLESD